MLYLLATFANGVELSRKSGRHVAYTHAWQVADSRGKTLANGFSNSMQNAQERANQAGRKHNDYSNLQVVPVRVLTAEEWQRHQAGPPQLPAGSGPVHVPARNVFDAAQALTKTQFQALWAAFSEEGAWFGRKASLMGGAYKRMCWKMREAGLLQANAPYPITRHGLRVLREVCHRRWAKDGCMAYQQDLEAVEARMKKDGLL